MDLPKLNELSGWKAGLGLLPFPLRGESGNEGRYVLLNGARGNLCLDLTNQEPGQETRNEAWSSNVGHYVSLNDGHVLVQRWNAMPGAVERYPLATVRESLERFHQYLESNEPDPSQSIVAHMMGVFRQLRGALEGRHSGEEALLVLLVLIGCVEDEVALSDFRRERWQIPEEAIDLASEVAGADWELLASVLRGGRPRDLLRPHFDLLLRHAAGDVFQEAHYQALVPDAHQLRLAGVNPPEVTGHTPASKSGVHFTPGALARALTESAVDALDRDRGHITILDPACGSGEFLREAARQLRTGGFTGRINLMGLDRSRAACAMTRFLLASEFSPADRVDANVWCGDALDQDAPWPKAADLILMNPPFVSWRDLDPGQRQTLSSALGPLATGRPDLASAFLLRAASALSAGGVLGTILPASILDGMSTRALREALRETVNPLLIARLGSQSIFPNARVDAALLVAGSAPPTDPPLAFWADHRDSSSRRALRELRRMRLTGDTTSPSIGDGFSIYRNPTLADSPSNWTPRPFREWRLHQQVRSLPRVKDHFVVRQGTLTGLNDVFLLPEAEYVRLPQAERPFFRKAVVNGSIVSGRLMSKTWIFFPYGDAEITDENDAQERVPSFFESTLVRNKDRLLDRSRIDEKNWWKLSEHRVWQVEARSKLVTTYFGDRGAIAYDSEGRHVVVQGYAWLPKSGTPWSDALACAYLALLNSGPFAALLAANSNQLASGAWNFSKRYVEDIPVPTLSPATCPPDVIEGLSEIGIAIQAEGLSGLGTEQRIRLTEFASAAYHMSDPLEP